MMSGTSTKSSSRSRTRSTGCGGPSTRTAMSSTRSSGPDAHQGCQAPAHTAVEEAGDGAEAHNHRQAAFLRSSQAPGNAEYRAPLAQGIEQPREELPRATAKTGAVNAGLSIARKLAALHLDLLRRPQPFRPAPLTTLCSQHTSSPPAGHGGMESRVRGQLTTAPQVPPCLRVDNVKSSVPAFTPLTVTATS